MFPVLPLPVGVPLVTSFAVGNALSVLQLLKLHNHALLP